MTEAAFRAALGAVLRRLREERGLSQTAVAEVLQHSQPTYSRIERGQYGMHLWTLRLAGHLFGLSVPELWVLIEREAVEAGTLQPE